MICDHDDFPLHQSSAPLLHLASDAPGAYDRYFYNGHDEHGRIFIAVALGVYPNRKVMDASFSVSTGGIQHNFRTSRLCDRDRTETAVGSIRVEVLRPMREHRISVSDSAGISADLVWRAVSPVLEEPGFRFVESGRTTMDYTRITQFGVWSGWVKVDDRRYDLDEFGRVAGCRDRSWGTRNSSKGLGTPGESRQFYWLWAPASVGDGHLHAAVNDDASGRSWHRSGALAARFPDPDTSGESPERNVLDESLVRRATTVGVDIGWAKGTRWPTSATITLDMWREEPLVVSYEPLMRFQMSGIGYTHPEWWHGAWRGTLAETRDVINLSEVNPLDPTMIHVQQVCRVSAGGQSGTGVLESLVIGPHDPSGFLSVLDGA